MRHAPRILLVASLLSGLAACGGKNATEEVSDPNAISAGQFTTLGPEIKYDPSKGTLTMGGTTVRTSGDSTLNSNVAASVTESGKYRTALAVNNDVYAATSVLTENAGARGTGYGTLTDTTLPTTGSASYTGDYIGTVYRVSDNALGQIITGDATLDADFEAETVGGSISARTVTTPAGAPSPNPAGGASNVDFVGIAIGSSGRFDGTTTGGTITNADGSASYTGAVGRVQGVFGGTEAASVGGVFTMTHTETGSGDTFVEQGAFVADKD